MRNLNNIILAATMAAGGLTGVAANAAPTNAGPATAPAQLQATVSPANNPAQAMPGMKSDAPVRGVIARLTTDALTPGGMDKLVSLFPDAQRAQIARSSSYSHNYGDKLDAQIRAITKTWNEKYGHEFASFNGQRAIGSDFFAIQMHNATAASKSTSATVDIKGFKNGSQLSTTLVCEPGNNWKIDAANSLTAQKLRDNLTTQLASLESQSAQWPSEQYDAYRLITRHVMMAVLDHPLASASDQPRSAQSSAPAQQNAKVTPVSTSQHHWWQFWAW
jgi:hypothetical protein